MKPRKVIAIALMIPGIVVLFVSMVAIMAVLYENSPSGFTMITSFIMFAAGFVMWDTEKDKTATIDMQDELTAPSPRKDT